MINEDILTALKNGIDRGESLSQVINTLIRTGYNPKEVEEASRFVSGTTLTIKPEDHLVMPEQKSILPKDVLSQIKPLPKLPDSSINDLNQKPIQNNSKPILNELNKLTPSKKSYFKEILLVIILLILIGILAATIIYRDAIIKFFS